MISNNYENKDDENKAMTGLPCSDSTAALI